MAFELTSGHIQAVFHSGALEAYFGNGIPTADISRRHIKDLEALSERGISPNRLGSLEREPALQR